MRISRLYIDHALQSGEQFTLDDNSAHYLRNVLRLKMGSQVCVFNGLGNEYHAEITVISRKQVNIAVHNLITRDVESPLKVRLGLGVARGERMDFAIQKAVELGVQRITPLLTNRCTVQIKADKEHSKRLHWQKIAQHASEQSGRTIRPLITVSQPLAQWLAQPENGLKIFLDPYATQPLKDLAPPKNQATLLAGPEGGFTDEERQLACQAGFIPVRLGPRILRTETAVLAALTALQVLWGDLNT